MRKILLLICVAIVLGFTACSGNKENHANSELEETITITHELGEVEVEKNPEKVIVFDFGILDTLDHLDIPVTGIPQATVPSYLEEYESSDYENVGSLKEPDFEKLAQIDPDLMIISGRQSTLYDQLEELGPVLYLDIDTEQYMDSFEEHMQIIGEIFDKEEEIEHELEVIEEKIASLQEKATKDDQKALVILANEDKISAYGPNSRFGIIHDVFGLSPVDEDIEASTHGMNVTFEYVMERDPDILYVIDRGEAIGEESSAEQIVENKLVEQTKAYENNNIFYLHPDYWYLSGGGLISVSEMVDEISESLASTE